MKTTGIVRRIDNLGRIVIPKEIRSKLKVLSGDEIEIYVDNDSIILKKYSYFNNNLKFFFTILKVFSKHIDKSILFFNNEFTYCFNSGTVNESKVVGNEIFNLYYNRECVESISFKQFHIINNEEYSFIGTPIIIKGDIYGYLMFFSNNYQITDSDKNIFELLIKLLIKNIEE